MSDDTARISTFQDFWPFYVSQHQKRGTRTLHFIGTSLGLLLSGTALLTVRPFLVLWGLVAAYGFAWVGHYFVEKNRPATFQYPLWSFLGDLRMYGLMWQGRMTAERERLDLEMRAAGAA